MHLILKRHGQRCVQGAVALLLSLAIWTGQTAHAANNEIVGAALKQLAQEKPISTGSAFVDANRERLPAFYASRSFKPVWSRDSGPKGKARALLRELQTSAAHALKPEFYGTADIEKLMASEAPRDLARLDFLLSGALVDYAHDMLNGRTTTSGNLDTNKVQPILVKPAKLIEQAAESGDLRQVIGGLVGKDRRYLRLVTKMVELKRMRQTGLWPQGDVCASPETMRLALALTGDLPFSAARKKGRMDKQLRQAIQAFQARNGLDADGTVGPATARALKEPLVARISRLKVNIERRRWQNRVGDGVMMYFNITDGAMKLVENDRNVGSLRLENDEKLLRDLPTFYGQIVAVQRSDLDKKSPLRLIFEATDQSVKLPQNSGFAVSENSDIAVSHLARVLGAKDKAGLRGLKAGMTMRLEKPLPLFVTYLTSWATRDGTLSVRADVYNRDPQVASQLGL